MIINYLILAHTNYAHLNALIEALDAPDVNFFIHIDKKSPPYHNAKANVFFVEDRANVIWGGFGMIEATIKLLKLAFDCIGEGYYCLISGADYPIRSNEEIKRELAKGGERIGISPAPLPHKPMRRFKYYHFDFSWRKLMTLSERVVTGISRLLNFKRDIPFKIYVGSQWFALSHECVTFILNKIKEDPRYIDFFRYAKIPDEAFFQTIIGNSRFLAQTKPNVTYTDWSAGGASPAPITKKHIKILQKGKEDGKSESLLFARKFNNYDESLLEAVEKRLRNKSI